MSSSYQKMISYRDSLIPRLDKSITCIDMHTGGEPLRVVIKGVPEMIGNDILEKRRYCSESLDHYRQLLIHEPRGHSDMYGCYLVEPNGDNADFGVIFFHNEGYSTMCGHAIIALTNLVVQMGWIDISQKETVIFDAPCGQIKSKLSDNNLASFEGVPSYVLGTDYKLNFPEIGELNFDIAYGGAFYAFVNAEDLDLSLSIENISVLKHFTKIIKQEIINSSIDIIHPFENDLQFLYGVIFISPPVSSENHSRNVCIFADGELDRSPTGSGVSARMALHFHNNEIDLDQEMRIESIVDSVFTGKVIKEVKFGDFNAVIPSVAGSAYITGVNEFVLEDRDPFPRGFKL